MSLEQEKRLESQYVMPTFARNDVEFVSGRGMHLVDAAGREYLDFLSGIGVCSLGHCHPKVVEALAGQADKLIHVSNYFYIEGRGELAEKLSCLLNAGSGAAGVAPVTWKSFFANSGAEANECAIKLARLRARHQAQERGENPDLAPSVVVTLVKSFHGRTLATLAATGQAALHAGFEPMPEGFLPTPINDVDSLRALFDTMGGSICAVMLECIQGESGVHVCSREFLQEVRRLCTDNGALMICDEVQCGVFRTGKPFGFQNFGVLPDVVTVAKGIASGMPAGACCAVGEVADVMAPGKHGSTFGGSNLAVAAALATLDELSKPEYAQSIQEVGAYLRDRLAATPGVGAVRGLGLMVGVDLGEGLDARAAVKAALDEGLVINAPGPRTLRFLPPLVCSKYDVDVFIEKLTATLNRIK